VREPDAKTEPLRITTDKLQVLPDAGLARTDTEVTLTSPSSHAVAQALELDNKARTITLEHVVAHLESAKKR